MSVKNSLQSWKNKFNVTNDVVYILTFSVKSISTLDIIVEDNTPVSSYDRVTSLCKCSSVSEVRKVFVYANGTGGTDAA